MITLERVRLVLWHFFDDVTIPVGNRCLLTGDNGSGKSTIVDAIQYVMAADLRKARFNAAAGDRRGGRDLAGYIRCKLGSEATEYLRGDTVGHVMLEFSTEEGSFTAAACIEAYTDGRTSDHFWIGDNLPVETLAVRAADGRPLSWRQFRDLALPRGIVPYDSASQYRRDFTSRLGVFRRMTAYNPYLEAFTRSVSFTPLVSVDRFVCDYILDEQPLRIEDMKANLESYKEAEREAHAAGRRIEALGRIMAAADEHANYLRVLRQQEYLKRRVDRDLEAEQAERLALREDALSSALARIEREIIETEADKASLESERLATGTALARDDTHLLFTRMKEKREELAVRLSGARLRADRWSLLRSQCAALLGRPLGDDGDDLEDERQAVLREGDRLASARTAVDLSLREQLSELADLDRGIRRFPASPVRLRDELKAAGIDARSLADLAEVTDPDWIDAVEGWLNTLRFACIVEPDSFQKALEIYDRLPREVAGVALPNLAKMRGAEKRDGSLASLVETDSPYARIYLDCVLGDVMTCDLAKLKNYSKAVTKDCMSYSRFTASRIKEDAYRPAFLGRRSREARKTFLLAETARLRLERDGLDAELAASLARGEVLRRVSKSLAEARLLFPSVAEAAQLEKAVADLDAELAAIDTSAFRDLEARIAALSVRIRETEERLARSHDENGVKRTELAEASLRRASANSALREREQELLDYVRAHEEIAADCEKYAAERLRQAGAREIAENYASARKGIETKSEKVLRDFRAFVTRYNNEFNAMLLPEMEQTGVIASLLERLEASELPAYLEKIARSRQDAEREFKDHFIARLNELIEDARESFREINETLKAMTFGHDQYSFVLAERSDRRGQIEIVRKTAEIASYEDGLFAQLADPAEREAAEALFARILHSSLDSPELRSICDYRTYFTYDIRIRDTQSVDPATGKAMELSLSRVLREKSGGEAQTPYYVAIAASFYRFFKGKEEKTVRFVLFDEAFDKLDDERIGKILEFFRQIGMQTVIAVPTEKIESIAPYMDRVNLVIRHGYAATVRDFRAPGDAP